MDVTSNLNSLNSAQHEAVTSPPEPVLVIAGAGSGKTRVLTNRAAWLIGSEGIAPQSLLAVTFTNKAAKEMRDRIETLLSISVNHLWIGTFHSLAHRLLRTHWRDANLPQAFQIIDADDQFRILKRLIKDSDVDDDQWTGREVQYFINMQKDEGLRAEHLTDNNDPNRRQMIAFYRQYQETCNRSGLVDFAELLLRAHELWRDNQEILSFYRQRFKHLLVDEFQDTNAIQYAWLRILAGETGVPFVVGDDDQSIYRWQGAKVEHIQQFQQDFPDAAVIKLEQNYRSSATILKAANAVITNNDARLSKNLWTEGPTGELIQVYSAYNERDEADFITGRLQVWSDHGNARTDSAVLYRSNAQSRVLEEALINAGLPYRIYGGLRFFERQEIKDSLAYLRLSVHRDDDSSFERIVNRPKRGIGVRTLEIIRNYARAHNCSMWSAAAKAAQGQLSNRATTSIVVFLNLVERISKDIESLPLHEKVDHINKASGLIDFFAQEKGERAATRIENLEELVSAAKSFQQDPDDALTDLDAFLSNAALEAGERQSGEWEDCVQLMTMHSAKGLEFPLVFLCGLEDGLFPHQRSLSDNDGLEEERRLCYVGITRAKEKLYVTYAEQRRLHGTENFAQPSRFISEIPEELKEEVRPQRPASRTVYKRPEPALDNGTSNSSAAEIGVRLGQRVHHSKFGDGIILSCSGQGTHTQVEVNFEQAGTKILVLAYANLELL